jgi:integrase
MASATKRGQGKWLGRYRGPDGKERTKTLPTKGEAMAWAQEAERGIRRGEWADPSRSRITVGDWSKVWFQSLSVKPTTRVNYESLLRNQVLPRWGSTRLDHLSLAGVKSWLAAMSSTISAGRVRQAYHVLSSMLDLAVADGRLSRNPAKPSGNARGMLPKVSKAKHHVYLSHAEVALLADESGPYRALILVLAYCGPRWGEATAFRVRDVNMLKPRISIRRTAVQIHGRIEYGTPKTNEVRDVVPPTFLRDELLPWMAGKGPDDLLFTAPEGGPLRVSNFRSRYFDAAAKRAGLALTPHDLRHTAASLAIQSGANVKAVQRMLGHASAAMTLDTYAGLFDTDLEAVAERMDQAVSEARADYLRIAEGRSPVGVLGQHGTHAV